MVGQGLQLAEKKVDRPELLGCVGSMTGSAVAELVVEHASATGPRQSGYGTEIVVRRSGSTVTDHDGCGRTGPRQIANNPVPGLHAFPLNGSLGRRGRGTGVCHALHDALDAD